MAASYFTTAFFHRPDELKVEVEQAGFNHEVTLPIEGPAWLIGPEDYGPEASWVVTVLLLTSVALLASRIADEPPQPDAPDEAEVG